MTKEFIIFLCLQALCIRILYGEFYYGKSAVIEKNYRYLLWQQVFFEGGKFSRG